MDNSLEQRISALIVAMNLDQKRMRIGEIEQQSAKADFWKDPNAATQAMKELVSLQKEVEEIEQLQELVRTGQIEQVEQLLKKLEVYLYFSSHHDKTPAILSVHAGQGGIEAMDWAAMLVRMYIRYAQNKGWDVTEADLVSGEEAGIKSSTLIINAPYAFGYLKHEAGTHRLVRQSPFNADHLRQTSFALVEVLPQLPETETTEVKEEDVEWQFFRASSQGGQNVQKVSTAVRLTHKPTGITVAAQSERYQEQNRKIALRLLASRLWALRQEEEAKTKQSFKGEYHPASWGTQIRSYVLHPYKLVKDLRTGVETSSAEDVLEGNLDTFVDAEVRLK